MMMQFLQLPLTADFRNPELSFLWDSILTDQKTNKKYPAERKIQSL